MRHVIMRYPLVSSRNAMHHWSYYVYRWGPVLVSVALLLYFFR